MKKQFKTFIYRLDKILITEMFLWGVPLLRISLGIVFFWFGLLKLLGVSPVEYLIVKSYPFFPYPETIYLLGVLEVVVGLGLIFKVMLRGTLILLWLQLLGTFLSLVLEPSVFFKGYNPFHLTMEGEFVVKNVVLFASGIVIGGYRLEPLK